MKVAMSSTPSAVAGKRASRRAGIESLREVRTHALAPDNICQPTEEELTDKSTRGSSGLDTEILVGGQLVVGTVDVSQHGRRDVDREDIVAVERKLNRAVENDQKNELTHR